MFSELGIFPTFCLDVRQESPDFILNSFFLIAVSSCSKLPRTVKA